VNNREYWDVLYNRKGGYILNHQSRYVSHDGRLGRECAVTAKEGSGP
jgi:hypothetical protein